MSLKETLIKFALKGSVKNMLDKLTGKLSGYRTLMTAGIGILVALLGVMFGPTHLGPIEVPKIESGQFFNILWEGLMVIFLRKSITK